MHAFLLHIVTDAQIIYIYIYIYIYTYIGVNTFTIRQVILSTLNGP